MDIYLDRFNMKRDPKLTMDSLEQMSLFQFMCRVDRRGNSLSLRRKGNIVKEKPFLRLDVRRPEAGGVARMCLRLHRPFRSAADDPVSARLNDAAAVLELHNFVQSAGCPVWLKKRYEKHNRVKKIKKDSAVAAGAGDVGRANVQAAIQGSCEAEAADHGVMFRSAVGEDSLPVKQPKIPDLPANVEAGAADHGVMFRSAVGEGSLSVKQPKIPDLPANVRGAVFRPAVEADDASSHLVGDVHGASPATSASVMLLPSTAEDGSVSFVQPVVCNRYVWKSPKCCSSTWTSLGVCARG